MSYQKLQGYLAVEIIPSDNCNVPFPGDVITGTNSSPELNSLVDESVNFNKLGVKTGDIVYNTTSSTAATVIDVRSDVHLTLNANIFGGDTQTYKIFPASPQSGAQDANNGCVLYVGEEGNLNVTTIGGTKVVFNKMANGFVPVQVKKVWGTNTDAKSIIGLW